MKKGFTLIELLAVIVILAIIGIITIPIIGNVIEESKKQALEASVKGIIDATNYFAITNNGVYEFIFDENNKGVTVDGKSLEYTGDVDAKGKLVLDRQGNISLCLMNDNYYIYKNYNSGIVVGNKEEDSCDVGYDVLTNKYIAFLESEGSASNVYSKDEVNNLISATTNEITNIKTSVETLQNNLSNYALKSELETTNSNIENLSSMIAGNTSSIENIQNKVDNINNYNFVQIYKNDTFTSSTSFTYTGSNITIPANSYFTITATFWYVNGQPVNAALMGSSTSTGSPYCTAESSNNLVSCTYSGYTTSSVRTLHAWAKYDRANTTNAVRYEGFYIQKQ